MGIRQCDTCKHFLQTSRLVGICDKNNVAVLKTDVCKDWDGVE